MGIALAFSSPLDRDSMPRVTGRELTHNTNPAPTRKPTPSPFVLADGIFIANDITIREAVSLWLADATAAEASYGLISTWETGGVTDMSNLFSTSRNSAASSFNEDISAWDTSGVRTMHRMFTSPTRKRPPR